MDKSRYTIFAGPFGCGKTTVAINYACKLKKTISNVVLCDLDITNPYYRAAEYKNVLDDQGIIVFVPPYTGTNVEMSVIPRELPSIFNGAFSEVVIDMGGDNGAVVLGRCKKDLNGVCNMWFVLNMRRPYSDNEIMSLKEWIEKLTGLSFSGIVNNTNIGNETDPAMLSEQTDRANRLASKLKLPIIMTTVDKKFIGKVIGNDIFYVDVFKHPRFI